MDLPNRMLQVSCNRVSAVYGSCFIFGSKPVNKLDSILCCLPS